MSNKKLFAHGIANSASDIIQKKKRTRNIKNKQKQSNFVH